MGASRNTTFIPIIYISITQTNQFSSTEAHAGTTRGNVRVYKYKVDFYTMDHPLSEVKKWMKKGFNAWSNPRIDAYLRKHNCPTLKFEETTVS